MKLMNSFKELKLGQHLGWRYINKVHEGEDHWVCVTKVIGFHKVTRYPETKNGLVYTTTDKITHKVLAKIDDTWDASMFLLNINYNDEMETSFTYQREFWEAWLLEDEHDYLEIIKHIMVEKL